MIFKWHKTQDYTKKQANGKQKVSTYKTRILQRNTFLYQLGGVAKQ